MSKIPVSVFIITQDEEKNIERVLNSVTDFQEVIVVDSGSKDKTPQLAESLGAKVFHQDWLGYAKQKQYAMQLCENDWVLNLDADEMLTTDLVKEIKSAVENIMVSGFRFQRNDQFIGKFAPALCKLPNNLRLYRKSESSFDAERQVHESADVDGREFFVRTPFLHFGYDDICTLVEKNNQYSTLRAEDKFSKHKKPSIIKLLLIFPAEFIKKYIFQRYVFFGYRGIILSVINANYAFLKEAKLFELHMRSKLNKK